eukprot:scaffold6521_cov18-Tisochrysis_lutea.AAC.1
MGREASGTSPPERTAMKKTVIRGIRCDFVGHGLQRPFRATLQACHLRRESIIGRHWGYLANKQPCRRVNCVHGVAPHTAPVEAGGAGVI